MKISLKRPQLNRRWLMLGGAIFLGIVATEAQQSGNSEWHRECQKFLLPHPGFVHVVQCLGKTLILLRMGRIHQNHARHFTAIKADK